MSAVPLFGITKRCSAATQTPNFHRNKEDNTLKSSSQHVVFRKLTCCVSKGDGMRCEGEENEGGEFF